MPSQSLPLSLAPQRQPRYANRSDAQMLTEFRIFTKQRKSIYADYDNGEATDEDLDANEATLLRLEDELHAREIDIPKDSP